METDYIDNEGFFEALHERRRERGKRMFKYGDIVECVNTNHTDSLTLGKRYVVLDLYTTKAKTQGVWIENDNGQVMGYISHRFVHMKTTSSPAISRKQVEDILNNLYPDRPREIEQFLGMVFEEERDDYVVGVEIFIRAAFLRSMFE